MKFDLHVHMIGNGSSGSGCSLRLTHWYHRLLARIMVREFGLDAAALRGDLDALYSARLEEMVSSSSLDRVVILAHEHTYDSQGRPLEQFGSLYVPNRYVIARARSNPRLLAGVSIHPARADALDELERCLEEGAVLMKCLPNVQNIDCSERRYSRFWQRMADARLPLLAHTGGELSLPVYDARFADPRFLRTPLEHGVTVIAAHCGTNSHPFDRNYLPTWISMAQQYPNLYGDNSGMQTPLRSKHFRTLLSSGLTDRIVHGSDVPIPISGRWVAMRGLLGWNEFREIDSDRNLLERDYRIKRAIGFPEATFTRAASLLRLQPTTHLT